MVAFVTCYHLSVTKSRMMPDVVPVVNAASGTKMFESWVPSDIATRLSTQALLRGQEFERQQRQSRGENE